MKKLFILGTILVLNLATLPISHAEITLQEAQQNYQDKLNSLPPDAKIITVQDRYKLRHTTKDLTVDAKILLENLESRFQKNSSANALKKDLLSKMKNSPNLEYQGDFFLQTVDGTYYDLNNIRYPYKKYSVFTANVESENKIIPLRLLVDLDDNSVSGLHFEIDPFSEHLEHNILNVVVENGEISNLDALKAEVTAQNKTFPAPFNDLIKENNTAEFQKEVQWHNWNSESKALALDLEPISKESNSVILGAVEWQIDENGNITGGSFGSLSLGQ